MYSWRNKDPLIPDTKGAILSFESFSTYQKFPLFKDLVSVVVWFQREQLMRLNIKKWCYHVTLQLSGLLLSCNVCICPRSIKNLFLKRAKLREKQIRVVCTFQFLMNQIVVTVVLIEVLFVIERAKFYKSTKVCCVFVRLDNYQLFWKIQSKLL